MSRRATDELDDLLAALQAAAPLAAKLLRDGLCAVAAAIDSLAEAVYDAIEAVRSERNEEGGPR